MTIESIKVYLQHDEIREAMLGEECKGVYAEAVVSYPTSQGDLRLQTLQSAGLWGLQGDADGLIDTFMNDELDDLLNHLCRFGISVAGFDVERVERVVA